MTAALGMPLVTTAWVLLEFANAIAASRARARFERVLARRAVGQPEGAGFEVHDG